MISSLPKKPETGKPCVGCGTCCGSEVCAIGMAMFSDAKTPCPGLVYGDGRVWCGLVLMDETKVIATKLGIGFGCDSG